MVRGLIDFECVGESTGNQPGNLLKGTGGQDPPENETDIRNTEDLDDKGKKLTKEGFRRHGDRQNAGDKSETSPCLAG
jgi:hypothetical protein